MTRAGADLPPELRSLAETARCCLNQMDMDPRSNELCPQLREANLSDIAKFTAAYDVHKSRAVPR